MDGSSHASLEAISQKIFIIRGMKVMLDADLAELYGVPTMRLNEQVKRNKERFPEDFMFRLTQIEKEKVIANCDNLSRLRFSYHSPYVFTEHGVAMLSSVLRSKRAIEMNIFIVRAFIKLREFLASNKDLKQRVEILEMEQERQGDRIKAVFSVVNKLLDEPEKPKNRIGFETP
jgi:hypothetical protein